MSHGKFRFSIAVFILLILSGLAAGCQILGFASLEPSYFSTVKPSDCRAHGVPVPDDAARTGTIVSSEIGTFGKMDRVCVRKEEDRYIPSPKRVAIAYGGCAVPVEADEGSTAIMSPSHQYRIYYTDSQCISVHEACHALYEVRGHTVQFNLRSMAGDTFAACPGKRF